MNELNSIKLQIQHALEQIEAFETKQTKAASGRIRASLGEIKKQVTGVRSALVSADKAGY